MIVVSHPRSTRMFSIFPQGCQFKQNPVTQIEYRLEEGVWRVSPSRILLEKNNTVVLFCFQPMTSWIGLRWMMRWRKNPLKHWSAWSVKWRDRNRKDKKLLPDRKFRRFKLHLHPWKDLGARRSAESDSQGDIALKG